MCAYRRSLAGKSTFLQTLAAREVPLPAHIDTYLLTHEAEPCEMSALDYVIDRCVRALGCAARQVWSAQ